MFSMPIFRSFSSRSASAANIGDATLAKHSIASFPGASAGAFAASADKPVVINVHNLKSRPYIDLSLQMLHYFGYDVHHDGYKIFYINPVEKIKRPSSHDPFSIQAINLDLSCR